MAAFNAPDKPNGQTLHSPRLIRAAGPCQRGERLEPPIIKWHGYMMTTGCTYTWTQNSPKFALLVFSTTIRTSHVETPFHSIWAIMGGPPQLPG